MTTPHTSLDGLPVAVVGAGPYGLAVAAHLRDRGMPLRAFGEPMESWRSRMPAGMYLKSAPAASSICDPAGRHRLEVFRARTDRAQDGELHPLSLTEFLDYGDWFQRACVPELERVRVTSVRQAAGGFELSLDSGEVLTTRAVVLATGIGPWARVPHVLAGLVESGLASHTSDHADLSRFRGQRVAVVGAGQSALESAALLREAGASPTLVVRGQVRFNPPPSTDTSAERPLPERLRRPGTPLGPGWDVFVFSHGPAYFRYLPDATREHLVRTVLGPAGAWWLRDRVEGRLPVLTGHALRAAEPADGGVRLLLDGPTGQLEADHVLAATGYRVDLARLSILDESLRDAVTGTALGAPRLDRGFQSSVPGLYFAGLSAADSFGPLMRFVAGTGFTARRITTALTRRQG